jgi:hypothetical protein
MKKNATPCNTINATITMTTMCCLDITHVIKAKSSSTVVLEKTRQDFRGNISQDAT